MGTNVPTHIYYLIVISALGMPPALYVATAAKLIKVTAKTIRAAVTTFVNMVFCFILLVPYWQYKYTTYIVTTKNYLKDL